MLDDMLEEEFDVFFNVVFLILCDHSASFSLGLLHAIRVVNGIEDGGAEGRKKNNEEEVDRIEIGGHEARDGVGGGWNEADGHNNNQNLELGLDAKSVLHPPGYNGCIREKDDDNGNLNNQEVDFIVQAFT